MVCKSILSKFTIPFTVVSTVFLTFRLDQTKAATLTDSIIKNGSVKNGYFSSKAIEERGGALGEFKNLFVNMDIISEKLIKALDWINNLPLSLPKLTTDLLTAIFHFLSKIVLQTPLFIFNNPYLKSTSLTFAIASITIVTVLTVFEAFMQMFKQKHTDFHTIIKRYSIVASISGFMPFAFESSFNFLNKLTQAISKIGIVNGGNASGFIYSETIGFFDTLIIALFDLSAIALLIPVCLQAGRRWFDIMCLACVSPIALTSWVFDRHKHYFSAWWSRVKALSLVQLVYAVFILLMGIFIFSTQSIQGGIFTLILKLLIVAGALWRLSNPPRFVSHLTGDKSDIFDSYDEGKSTFKDIYDTLTLKNFRPVKFMKKQSEQKQKKVQSLRKQYKRRYVGDLL
jgi:hypothetical protein